MAPDAEIIAVQVFSTFRGAQCGGLGACVASFTSDQIRALDFVLQQAGQRPVASVDMSLGGGRSTTACDNDLTKGVIDQLRAAGVATAIASGNDGFRDSVSFPGCISTAVTVGARSKQDEVASFSNCGPQVDLHAPGVGINSSIPNGRFAAFSGTSMATPHVAGAFAALRSLHPAASVDRIEQALKSTGLDVGGRARIRVFDAANALGPAPPRETSAQP
jgi:subtilisin family serine protease